VWKDAQVKLGGFFSIVIKPEEWRDIVHGWHGIRQEVNDDRPAFRYESDFKRRRVAERV
jgi:hypothetical protein